MRASPTCSLPHFGDLYPRRLTISLQSQFLHPACIPSCSLQVVCPPRAVPGQLPFLRYLPGPILGSASPPVKLTFPLPSTLHVCSMILLSCPHTVLGEKKKRAKPMKFTVPYLHGGAGRGVDGSGKGGGGLLGIGIKAMHQTSRFPAFQSSV